MSYYREQLEKWLKEISVNTDKVLDIGGSANPISKRVKEWNVNTYRIIDNNNEKDFHEKWEKPNLIYDMNIPYRIRGEELVDEYIENFDIVFCLEVAEYIWNPYDFIRNIYAFLKRGGIAYISFPAIYPIHNPKEFDYLRYTKEGIKKLLHESNFSEVEIKERVPISEQSMYSLASFYNLEGMRAVKGDSVIFDTGYLIKTIK